MARESLEKRIASLKRRGWEKVERGAIEKWEKGMEVEGTFIEVRAGSVGFLVDVEVEGEHATYGCPTILRSKLQGFDEGDGVLIICTGKIKVAGSKKGNDAWNFEVFRKGGNGE